MTVNNEGDESATGDDLQIDLLLENQKLRTEKNEIFKQIEFKIDAITEKLTEHRQKFNELSDRFQSVENLVSKISKTDEDDEPKENSKQADKTPEKLPNTIDSDVPKQTNPVSEKRFVLKHVFKNVESFVEGEFNYSDFENHFNVHCQSYDEDRSWGLEKFLKWDEMKNEYLVDGSLTVEAHVEIIETSEPEKEKIRKFDESQQDVSDLVVSVRNTKFYVVRMYLAAQSSFFKALLLGNFAESKKSEITLTGIDPTDFHYFLEVLYGEWAMDESTVEGVALLADMYDAPTAVRRCENFLLNESKKSLKKKLQMATRYHLEDLKKKCLEEIKTVTDLRSVLPADLNDLDPKVMADLLKKSISFL
ncbi:unnamed protein product [Caenorhabditis nigoni]